MKLISTLYLLLSLATSSAYASLQLIDGKVIPLASLKGHWVLINYWAEWCPTCMNEIPELNKFHQKLKNKKVDLFGINYDELTAEKQQILAKKHGILYPLALKETEIAQILGEIVGLPVTYVFNPKGQLVNTLYGGQTVASLLEAIDSPQLFLD